MDFSNTFFVCLKYIINECIKINTISFIVWVIFYDDFKITFIVLFRVS